MKKSLIIGLLSACVLASGCEKKEENKIEDVAIVKVTCSEMKEEVNKGAILLDVRTKEEYDEKHLDNAINIDYYQDDFLDQVLEELPDKNKAIVLYCRSGVRAEEAANVLLEEGYRYIFLLGGITECES